jgi:hypothetical protein
MRVCVQSTVDTNQEEEDKDGLGLGFDQGQRGEAGGVLAWAGVVGSSFGAPWACIAVRERETENRGARVAWAAE